MLPRGLPSRLGRTRPAGGGRSSPTTRRSEAVGDAPARGPRCQPPRRSPSRSRLPRDNARAGRPRRHEGQAASVGSDTRSCERFRTFSACAWPIGLLRPTARVVFAGSNVEDLKAKEPNWFFTRNLCWIHKSKARSRTSWSSHVFDTSAEWSLKSSSLIRADDLTVAIARVEAKVQKASSLP